MLTPVLTGLALIAVMFSVAPALVGTHPAAVLEPLTFSLAVAPTLRDCARSGCHTDRAPVLSGALRTDEASRRAAFEAVRRYVTPGDASHSALYLRAMGGGSCAPARFTAGSCQARALSDWINGHAVHACLSP